MFDRKSKKGKRSTPILMPWDTQKVPSVDGRIMRYIGHFSWAWRLELAILLALITTAIQVHYLVSLSLLFIYGSLYLFRPTWRPILRRGFHNARVRRRWNAGMRATELAKHGRSPRVVRIHPTSIGDELRIRLPGGMSVASVIDKQKALTAWLEAMDITVERDRQNARYCHISVSYRDIFPEIGTIPWPLQDRSQTSIWDDIPVGIDLKGNVVTINLDEKHVLTGGLTGYGKSVFLSALVAVAAGDPSCNLILLDGTEVDMGMWEDCAQVFVGADPTYALAVLKCVQTEINRRITWMRAQRPRRRKIGRDDPWPIYVIATDELAYFMQFPEIQIVMQDIINRGRKAGFRIIAAIQKPSEKQMPTGIRDMFTIRAAFRSATHDASDTIMGRGSAAEGYSAFDFSVYEIGVAWLRAKEKPIKIKAFFLSDVDIDALAERFARLRANSIPIASIKFPTPTAVAEVISVIEKPAPKSEQIDLFGDSSDGE